MLVYSLFSSQTITWTANFYFWVIISTNIDIYKSKYRSCLLFRVCYFLLLHNIDYFGEGRVAETFSQCCRLIIKIQNSVTGIKHNIVRKLKLSQIMLLNILLVQNLFHEMRSKKFHFIMKID